MKVSELKVGDYFKLKKNKIFKVTAILDLNTVKVKPDEHKDFFLVYYRYESRCGQCQLHKDKEVVIERYEVVMN